ncbi:MAG: hypothetical protein PHC51_06725 [bacterium]|nr:hypothetical protein [bacterium]
MFMEVLDDLLLGAPFGAAIADLDEDFGNMMTQHLEKIELDELYTRCIRACISVETATNP